MDFNKNYGRSKLVDCYFNEAVATTLKELREINNYSYQDVAKKINYIVSRQVLCRYELQQSKVRFEILKELAKIYNLTTKELFDKINYTYISNLSKYKDEID